MGADSVEVSEVEGSEPEDRLDERPQEKITLEDRVEAEHGNSRKAVVEEIREEDYSKSHKYQKYAKSASEDKKGYDTFDGAVAVFYNSQKGEIILEFKTDSHPVPEFRGKYAPIGGTTQVGESAPETLTRELKEEDPDAYKILIKALIENGRKVDEIKGYVDGVPSVTSVYAAEIKDLQEWETAKYTKLTEGDKIILNFWQALGTSNDAFAFQSGEVVKNVIRSNLEERLYTKSPKASLNSQMFEYKPQLYISDIFHNKSPSLTPVHASYNSLNFN